MKAFKIVLVLSFIAIGFQNCSQNGAISVTGANTTNAAQTIPEVVPPPAGAETPAEISNEIDTETDYCAQYKITPRECANSLRLKIKEGIIYTGIDTSLALLQKRTVKLIPTAFQISEGWPNYTPNRNGALFYLGSVFSSSTTSVSQFQIKCYIDLVESSGGCNSQAIQVPLFNDYLPHLLTVAVSSNDGLIERSFSIPVARWKQMDKQLPQAVVSSDKIIVQPGTVARSNAMVPSIQIGAGAYLLFQSVPFSTVIQIGENADFLLDSAMDRPETILEMKEGSRAYIMGHLANGTIRTRPGTLIFSDSAVQNIKLEILP